MFVAQKHEHLLLQGFSNRAKPIWQKKRIDVLINDRLRDVPLDEGNECRKEDWKRHPAPLAA